MDITPFFEDFIKKSKNKPYKKICRSLLLGGKSYSLNSKAGFEKSENLGGLIKECVTEYTHDKDSAISMFKAFVLYLQRNGVDVQVDFPPIPVSNTFERLMFIAKYLQDSSHFITDLPDLLWVSSRTVEEDLRRLRGQIDPIQVCGKEFHITDTVREDGRLYFLSTAHPLFLAENLTQVLIMLKGLKEMSANPLYEQYAMQTASDIWMQLSDYAKERIHFVLSDLLPDDYAWYASLEKPVITGFYTEEMCSRVGNTGVSVMLDCMKNQKDFCVEYETEDGTVFYKGCQFIEQSYKAAPASIDVECSKGRVTLLFDKVIRSAYTAEELTAE